MLNIKTKDFLLALTQKYLHLLSTQKSIAAHEQYQQVLLVNSDLQRDERETCRSICSELHLVTDRKCPFTVNNPRAAVCFMWYRTVRGLEPTPKSQSPNHKGRAHWGGNRKRLATQAAVVSVQLKGQTCSRADMQLFLCVTVPTDSGKTSTMFHSPLVSTSLIWLALVPLQQSVPQRLLHLKATVTRVLK